MENGWCMAGNGVLNDFFTILHKYTQYCIIPHCDF